MRASEPASMRAADPGQRAAGPAAIVRGVGLRATIGVALAAAIGGAVACGGVQLGGQTLMAPVERPAVHAPRAADAATLAGGTVAPGAGEAVDEAVAAEARTSPGAAVLAARAATGCFVAGGRPFDVAQPSDGPVDPWRAVDHGRPRVLPHETSPGLDDGEEDDRGIHPSCTAAHDHCLRDCTWLITTELPPYTSVPTLHEEDPTADGFGSIAETDAYQAFRSLPVTRRNLDVGMLVLVSADPPHAHSVWMLGEAEAIDWDAGTLRLRGVRRDFDLAWARVAVLRATRDGAVEVLGGLTRDRLAIHPDELVVPREP